jgi:ribosomal protein S12 methylthiotransferase
MSASAPRVGFVSLGCPKALVDSERILTQLRIRGYEISPSYQGSDLVVVNTCGFIDSAIDESLEAIGEALESNGKVVVTGCLGANPARILEKHPKVLAVTGPHATEQVLEAVHTHLPRPHDPHMDLVPAQGIRLTPRHYAYLKISEGCNNKCSFCIIPSLRGKLASRPLDQVMHEAQRLVAAGVKELLVISQDTSAYGVDLRYAPASFGGQEYETRFVDLARALGSLGVWVRMHYVYPYPHVDAVLPLMADGKVLPYLDIPFQHGSPSVLKRMKRPAHAENTLDRIHAWRRAVPELTLRSSFIVGFPGETDAEFTEMLDWLDSAQLDRVGCFKYSPVQGATANDIPGAVDPAVMDERYERFMQKAAAISEARLAAKVGSEVTVLVDSVDGSKAIGRTQGDAPEIDGVVNVKKAKALKPGEFTRVRITTAGTYDLAGEPVT